MYHDTEVQESRRLYILVLLVAYAPQIAPRPLINHRFPISLFGCSFLRPACPGLASTRVFLETFPACCAFQMPEHLVVNVSSALVENIKDIAALVARNWAGW